MRKRLVFVLLLILTLVGCGSNPMVGTWQLQIDESITKNAPGGGPKVEFKFMPDGTFEQVYQEGNRKIVASGTYELKDQRLFLSVTKQNGKEASPSNIDVTVTSDFKSFEVPDVGKVIKQ